MKKLFLFLFLNFSLCFLFALQRGDVSIKVGEYEEGDIFSSDEEEEIFSIDELPAFIVENKSKEKTIEFNHWKDAGKYEVVKEITNYGFDSSVEETKGLILQTIVSLLEITSYGIDL